MVAGKSQQDICLFLLIVLCVLRAAVKVLQAQGQTTFHSQPELPGTTPDGLLTSLFPIGCTVEVLPYVGQYQTDWQLTLIEPVS